MDVTTLHLNKAQWALILISVAAVVLYLGFGVYFSLSHWVNLLFFGMVAIVVILFFYLALRQRNCSNCGAKSPRVRTPQNERQALYGGWTCPNCSAELDSNGNALKK